MRDVTRETSQVGVFVEGHGFYVYAALGLAITEAILWVLGHGEG